MNPDLLALDRSMLFSLTIPCSSHSCANLSLMSELKSGSRPVRRAIVSVAAVFCALTTAWVRGQGLSLRMWKWLATWLTGIGMIYPGFGIHRISFCHTERFQNASITMLKGWWGEHQSSGGYKEVGPSWEDHIKARGSFFFSTPRSVSVWKYFTIKQHQLEGFPIHFINEMKHNIIIIFCLQYSKCIESIICGGNGTWLRNSLFCRKWWIHSSCSTPNTKSLNYIS